MAACEKLGECAFFAQEMPNMPLVTGFFKELYCHGDHSICARLRVSKAMGREAVPIDLFPNDEGRADELLRAHGTN